MKKILSISLALLILISCKKNSNDVNNNELETESLSELTQEVIHKKSLEEIKQGYILLSSKDKEALWEMKLDIILKNDSKKLNSKQKEIIQLMKHFLSQNGIDELIKNNSKAHVFMQNHLEEFERNFTKPQQLMLVECAYIRNDFSLLNAEEYIEGKHKKNGNNSQNVNKNLNNNFYEQSDSSGLADADLARGCTCLYNLGCVGWNNDCDNSTCATTAGGCGLFGTSRCKNRCHFNNPEPTGDNIPIGTKPHLAKDTTLIITE